MCSFIHVFFTDPPDPPYMTVVSSVLSLNVTWSSSVQENIIRILDYRIKVFDDITLKRVRQYNRITSSSLVIENLKRNRTYIVIIQARNEVGYGKSANISATTLLTGTTNHSLSWNFVLLDFIDLLIYWFIYFQSSQIDSFCVPVYADYYLFGATLQLNLRVGNFVPHLQTVKTGGKSLSARPVIVFARDLTNKQLSCKIIIFYCKGSLGQKF